MKYLILLGLFVYIVYKIGSFFFRAGAAAQELKNYKQKDQPDRSAPKKNNKINGGEYVDYEEVK